MNCVLFAAIWLVCVL